MENSKIISKEGEWRKQIQECVHRSDTDPSELTFGIRLAYLICAAMLLLGVVGGSLFILGTIFLIALTGALLPNHPFQYLYNHFLAEDLGKPKLEPNTHQLKFASSIATIWIGAVMFLFITDHFIAAQMTGGILIVLAFLASTIDFKLPYVFYNKLLSQNKMTVHLSMH